jgi:hypothetical protein
VRGVLCGSRRARRASRSKPRRATPDARERERFGWRGGRKLHRPGGILFGPHFPVTAGRQERSSFAAEVERLGGDLGSALDAVAFPAYLVDREGRIRALNKAAIDLVGDVRGKLASSVVGGENRELVRQTIAQNHGLVAKVLLIEGNDERRRELAGALEADGHTVVAAAHADGLTPPDGVAVVVTDTRLDRGAGRRLAETLAERDPRTRAVHTRGFVTAASPLPMLFLDRSTPAAGVARVVTRLLNRA